MTCRLYDKAPQSVPNVLAGCIALAQNKYLTRHNAALKTLFFEIVHDLGLIESVPPWYSPVIRVRYLQCMKRRVSGEEQPSLGCNPLLLSYDGQNR